MSRGLAGAHLGARESHLTREANRSGWSLGTETSVAGMPQRVSPVLAQRDPEPSSPLSLCNQHQRS